MKEATYLAITPARDEQKLLPNLIQSMVMQTHLPKVWILIDDGSTDATPRIMDDAAARYPWIRVHHIRRDGARDAGGEGVIMKFLPPEERSQVDFLFRLDADLSFGPTLVESLLNEF